MTALYDCPAPAKLNLFLHINGRRADGYHLLQSVFQLIDLGDHLDFHLRTDGQITRIDPLPGVALETDLVVRAARALQAATGTSFGADIALRKRIPMGGGLGGGSSDAATTLIALNRLWELGLARKQLMDIGVSLGADVPFFVFGQNAYAEGIGETLTALSTPGLWFAVIHPGVSVPTPVIFQAPELTRDTKALKMLDFSADAKEHESVPENRVSENRVSESDVAESAVKKSAGSIAQAGKLPEPAYRWRVGSDFGHNDLEPVAVARFPEVGAALDWLRPFGPARMSGSGACVFCALPSREAASNALRGLPQGWTGWVCESLAEHPLRGWLEVEV